MSAGRCVHTAVTLPECSCLNCCREQVRRYAPWLIAGEEGKRGDRVVAAKAPARIGALR